jgi:hypothetical protein
VVARAIGGVILDVGGGEGHLDRAVGGAAGERVVGAEGALRVPGGGAPGGFEVAGAVGLGDVIEEAVGDPISDGSGDGSGSGNGLGRGSATDRPQCAKNAQGPHGGTTKPACTVEPSSVIQR